MASKKDIWVSPRDGGKKWEVQREGAQRPSKVTDTKGEAEKIARDMGRRDRVEVVVQRKDGTIQSKDSYGNDPNPPKDTEH